MALSIAVADDHISNWTARLARGSYPFTAKWPKRVFRHDPIENVAAILNSGEILSRDGSAGKRIIDAAEADVVNVTDRAHQKVRMYFRPRTPTQYRMEGIRKQSDLYGNAHAPTLAMMIFDARTLLTRDGVEFSNCNMQSGYARTGSDDHFFQTEMNFSKIFHHGPHDRDDTITKSRCAEVLCPSPLRIEDTLQHIYCRSQAEFETLVNLLTPVADVRWRPIIRISDDMKLFERRFPYVETVSITGEGLLVRLAPRHDFGNIDLQVLVKNARSGENLISFRNQNMRPIPSAVARLWKFPHQFEPGLFSVAIDIEQHSAFRASLRYEAEPF